MIPRSRIRHGLKMYCITAILMLCPIAIHAQDKPPDKESLPAQAPSSDTYDDMVKKLQAGDLTIDFTDLRMKSMHGTKHSALPDSTMRDVHAKLNEKNYEEALKLANAMVAYSYVNIAAHIAASDACNGLGKKDEANLHHDVALRLLRSIYHSGTGASTDTAFKVISVDEEYALMHAMGLRPGRQSLKSDKSGVYDVLEMTDPKDNSKVTWYFDISLSFGHEFDEPQK